MGFHTLAQLSGAVAAAGPNRAGSRVLRHMPNSTPARSDSAEALLQSGSAADSLRARRARRRSVLEPFWPVWQPDAGLGAYHGILETRAPRVWRGVARMAPALHGPHS